VQDDIKSRIAAVIQAYSAQGIHRTGTEVDEISGDWLMRSITDLGQVPEAERFNFDRVVVKEAGVSLGKHRIEGVPLYDCSYTGPDGIEGSIGQLGSDSMIGLTVMEAGHPDRLRDYMDARRQERHKAIILVTDLQLPADGAAPLNAENFDSPFGPPVLQVPNENLAMLQRAAEEGQPVKLVVDCEYQQAEAVNVVCEIQGKDPTLAPLIVMTPRSGWWACASERGGGIAVFLEMLRYFGLNTPQRSIVFTANTGHELGHTGLDHFLKTRAHLLQEAHCWIHLGANFAASISPMVRLQFSNADLRTQFMAIAGALRPGAETKVGERPLGEARNVFDGKGDFVSILGGNGLFHHPADLYPEAVDLAATVAWSQVMVKMAAVLAE